MMSVCDLTLRGRGEEDGRDRDTEYRQELPRTSNGQV